MMLKAKRTEKKLYTLLCDYLFQDTKDFIGNKRKIYLLLLFKLLLLNIFCQHIVQIYLNIIIIRINPVFPHKPPVHDRMAAERHPASYHTAGGC